MIVKPDLLFFLRFCSLNAAVLYLDLNVIKALFVISFTLKPVMTNTKCKVT